MKTTASPILAAALMGACQQLPWTGGSSSFVVEDAERFAALFADGRVPGAPLLKTEYLERGTRGVTIFTPNRIDSAENLAKAVARDTAAYRRAITVCLPIARRMQDEASAIIARIGTREIKDLLSGIPVAASIMSLPGIGPVSCGIFLGELGNPAYFRNPRQIIKYAGYDPKEDDSGSRVGRKIISKKGRWLLRKCLFFMALQVVQRSSFFKLYYDHKKKGLHRALKKKEALCAVILKLIRVIFALMRDGRMFAEEMDRCREAA